jgi:DNA polymerase-3 subunit alpha
MFVHLRCRSAYSLLEGAMNIGALRDAALKHEMPALGLCDRDNLFGALEFSEVMSGAGIQPIIGMTLHIAYEEADPLRQKAASIAPVALIAPNRQAYEALMRLTTAAFFAPAADVQPQISIDQLFEEAEHLFLLTGAASGPLGQLLLRDGPQGAAALLQSMQSHFGERLFMELQRHGLGEEDECEPWFIDAAYERGIGLVATNDAHFIDPERFEAHTALLSIADGTYLSQEDKRSLTPLHHFASAEEMAKRFQDLPEAIANSGLIVRRCHFRPRTHEPILPSFTSAEGLDEADELERQAREGLEARLAEVDLAAPREDYDKRLAHELAVIRQMGFPGYFLIVADFIKWAKAQGIPVGPGRGSGAGSLVAWVLTITDLDPLRFGLLFERFLNPERVSMPDFDIDFCQDRRGEVIDYVRDRYGADRVAQIITFGTLQARAVLRDVGRVLQLPFGLVDRLCKMVPSTPANPVTLAQSLEMEPGFNRLRRDDPAVGELLDMAVQLEGLYRNASTHAAGVVIGDRPLTELVPLYRDPRSELPATQFNMKWVEPAGLVKFDFLGLKTLTVIDRAVRFVHEHSPDFDIERIAFNDRKTFELLASGHAIGVFQLESAGMRETLRKVKPDQIEDIIALISLYRPGPMKNIDTYVERKFGKKKPDYLHPSLKEVLQETYGVIIYQEQVMQIAQILSGYSLGEADLLRRAMGKKKPEEMAKQKVRFLEGAQANGVDAKTASHIFDLVAEFAGYGFNKSHAAAYALIAYQTAYLKAHYPAEFMAGLMSLDIANTEKLAAFVQEARRMEIDLRGPDINRSTADFSIEEGGIRYALGAVRNVSFSAMQALVAAREAGGVFASLEDLARRIDPSSINKRMLENLARTGGFDSLEPDRSHAFAAAEAILNRAQSEQRDRQSAQVSLFGGDEKVDDRLPVTTSERWSSKRCSDEEFHAVGFYLSGHPLDRWMPAWQRRGNIMIAQLVGDMGPGETRNVRLAATVRDLQERFSAKRKEKFAFLALSDPSGELEIFVPGEQLAVHRELLKPGNEVALSVKASTRSGELRMSVEGVQPLAEALSGSFGGLRIWLRNDADTEALRQCVEHAAQAADSHEDRGQIRIRLPLDGANGVDIALPGSWPVGPSMQDALSGEVFLDRLEEM